MAVPSARIVELERTVDLLRRELAAVQARVQAVETREAARVAEATNRSEGYALAAETAALSGRTL
jgi:hypothetical protein